MSESSLFHLLYLDVIHRMSSTKAQTPRPINDIMRRTRKQPKLPIAPRTVFSVVSNLAILNPYDSMKYSIWVKPLESIHFQEYFFWKITTVCVFIVFIPNEVTGPETVN